MTEITDAALDALIKLMRELQQSVYHPRKSNEPSSGAKPKSKPPLDLAALDLLHDCQWEIECHAVDVYHACNVVRLLGQVRRHLGYDAPLVQLTSTSCHVCESALVVANDASTNVMCTNPECGHEYKQADWIEFLYAKSDAT